MDDFLDVKIRISDGKKGGIEEGKQPEEVYGSIMNFVCYVESIFLHEFGFLSERDQSGIY